MNCPEFLKLKPIEQEIMLNELIHAVRNDRVAFITAKQMINGAKARGHFDNVTFMPERQTVNENY